MITKKCTYWETLGDILGDFSILCNWNKFFRPFLDLVTRTVTRSKYKKHKTIKIRYFKDYNKNLYLERLNDINMPELDEISDLDEVDNSFVNQL